MNQIFIHIIGAILAAVAVKLLRLNTKRVIISHQKPISWVWKLMVLVGKFLFYYGLLVFFSNLMFGGLNAANIGTGASMLAFGLVFWIWGSLVIYFKRN